jgi:phosphatidylglycerophosphatase GEP4
MVQSFNVQAVLFYPYVRLCNKSLAIPHVSVPTVASVNPEKLRALGFKGVVFDKDNTLTHPYENRIAPSLSAAVARFKELFDDRIVILSNFAGTRDDPGHVNAQKIEEALDIHVLRHAKKKPGCIREVVAYFGCDSADLVMCGDRVFTDIVFGNRHSMLTIHTSLLTEKGDNRAAVHMRNYETPLMQKWQQQGIAPPPHPRYHPGIVTGQSP